MVFLPLLFPDGHLPSRRWRPVPWLGLAFVGFAIVNNGLAPGPIELGATTVIENPTGIDDAEVLLDAIGTVAGLCGLAAGFGAVTSLVLRFRRARGDQRQQLKWFSFGAALLVVGVFAGDFFPVAQGLVAVFFPLLPVAAGIAILKYRLYDIDRIISRTIVYGLLTAALIGGYAGGVLLVQSVLPVANDSPLVVAASTLAMAALFSPLRRGIQTAVDRRFYRRKYDAIQTVENFSARLRDETDLEVLTYDLVQVAKATMQPAHVSLWLRTHEAER